MATCVAENPRPSITPAYPEKRDAERGTFDVVTRVWYRCGRYEHARHRAQQPQFIVESAGTEVVLDGFTPSVTLIGGACIDVSEDAPDDFPVVGDQRLCRRAHVCQYHAMSVTRQRFRDVRRARVSELIGNRPLSARSVLASSLLGADQPRLPVGALVAMASLFGISAGAARTCLWRMASSGELTSDEGSYALAGRLLERRQRVDDASRIDDAAARRWDGTWELAIVSLERRPAADRLELRKAATALHLAELREGVWIRPDNLDPQRLPTSRAVLDQQCTHFHGAATDITAGTMRSLFCLDAWADDARILTEAMNDEPDATGTERFTYQFALSIAVVRHLQLDPLLPAELIPNRWPGRTLRSTYRRFDEAFKQRINDAFRQSTE
jgi:phenylacetic acid degradation operon negative regulatory protein